MTFEEALKKVGAPTRGATSILSGVMSGEYELAFPHEYSNESHEKAREKLKYYEDAQMNCKSDAAYWGYMGDIAYWRMVLDLFEAASITGMSNLPDIDPGEAPMIVMSRCAWQEGFGKNVLAAAKARKSSNETQ